MLEFLVADSSGRFDWRLAHSPRFVQSDPAGRRNDPSFAMAVEFPCHAAGFRGIFSFVD
jgi:hypothetical protein